MTATLLVIVAAYLVGALSGGLLIGRLLGKADLRAAGSGNAGATNALRTGGRLYGVLVLLFDLAKGVVAAGLLPLVVAGGPGWLAFACGAAAVIGHVYPVYFGFAGGKGAATLIGVLLVLAPGLLVPGVVTFVAVLVLSGMVSLSILLAMGAVVLAQAVWMWPALGSAPVLFAFAMWLLMLFTHRSNVARILAGEESRFERVMLLRRRR